MMAKGPPVWVSDPHGLALPEGETHIQQLWFSSDGAERSAKLVGAVDGDERQVCRAAAAAAAALLAGLPRPALCLRLTRAVAVCLRRRCGMSTRCSQLRWWTEMQPGQRGPRSQ